MRTTPSASRLNRRPQHRERGRQGHLVRVFAPPKSKDGWDVTGLPYFKNGTNFMAPQTDIAAVRDSYQNVVHVLREKNPTQGVTITSKYKDLQGEPYQTEETTNPLLLEGSGYSKVKGHEDQVQALEDRARALEKLSEDIKEAVDRLQERVSKDGES